MPKKILVISIGHEPKHPGYEDKGTSEYAEMAVVAGITTNILHNRGFEVHLIGTGTLKQKVQQINYINPICAVEFHLNECGDCGATGFETLYKPGNDNEKNFASYIHQELGQVLGSRDRGVKEGWYHMVKGGDPDYFLDQTACPSAITEMYFLDSKEADSYVNNFKFYIDVANAVANGIEAWCSAN